MDGTKQTIMVRSRDDRQGLVQNQVTPTHFEVFSRFSPDN